MHPDPTNAEFKYPYVFPAFDISAALCEHDEEIASAVAKLTPLEKAFLAWWMETRCVHETHRRMQHPSYPYRGPGAVDISSRRTLRDLYMQMRRSQPFRRIYNHDRVLYLLHRELEQLSPEMRAQRWGAPNDLSQMRLNKESLFAAEQAEAQHYLRILTLIANINGANIPTDDAALPKPSSTNRSVDRVLAQAEKLILGGKTEPALATGSDASE